MTMLTPVCSFSGGFYGLDKNEGRGGPALPPAHLTRLPFYSIFILDWNYL